jgi:putative ABC transport system permease protein
MLHDVRTALRSLLRAPVFTVTTIFILALAAGANAAILAIAYGVLLKPLPSHQPDRLVSVWPQQFQSNADLQYTRERGGEMFSAVASIAPGWTMSLTGSGEPTRLTIGRVSDNMFDLLGVAPLIGRTFRSRDDGVMVLSHRLWQTRFGGDPAVVGRTVQLDGASITVIGVMPRTFDILELRSDAYTVFRFDESAWYHRLTFSMFVARLRDGVPLERANTSYTSLVQEMRRERKLPDEFGRTAALVDLRTALVGDVKATLVVLAVAVVLILLIAAANVGTLQMTRATMQARDLAIRAALGASRRRLVRHVLVESVLIAAAAAALGVAGGSLLLSVLLAVLPRDTPRVQEIAIDPIVAGMVIASAVMVGLLAGLPPALGVSRLRVSPALMTARSSESRSAKRTRTLLVAAEVALAVVLTIAAGLMVQTLGKLQAVDPGFRAGNLLTLHVQPVGARFRTASVADYYQTLLERVRALPGVTAAGAIQHLPFSGYSWNSPIDVDGHVVPPGAMRPTAASRFVTPGYFIAMQQPVLAGRAIEAADALRPEVVVVNRAFADRFFGSPAATLGRGVQTRGARGAGPRMTIVGVVGNVRHNALTAEPAPELYNSIAKDTIPAMMLAVRGEGDPRALVAAVRDAIWSIDRDVPVSDIQTMEGRIAASLGRPRLLLTLLGAFALIGLLLAVVGVYGVVVYSVTQRWRELGIMVALGAERIRIVRGVVREALVHAVLGLAIGIPSALAASRLMRTVVWGVSPTDPVTYAVVTAGTLIVVIAAAVVPARRAASVDPADALKGS